jgi:hypothetical protein
MLNVIFLKGHWKQENIFQDMKFGPSLNHGHLNTKLYINLCSCKNINNYKNILYNFLFLKAVLYQSFSVCTVMHILI